MKRESDGKRGRRGEKFRCQFWMKCPGGAEERRENLVAWTWTHNISNNEDSRGSEMIICCRSFGESSVWAIYLPFDHVSGRPA